MAIVNIYVRGGVIQNVAIPQGCDVIIRVVDYDCEGMECRDIDDNGDSCCIALYEEAPDKNQVVG